MSQSQGGGGNRALGGLAAGYTQSQVDEMKQFNAGLTAAGKTTRPNCGITGGRRSVAIPRSTATKSSHGNASSSVGYDKLGKSIAESSSQIRQSPIIKQTILPRARSPERKLSPVRNTFTQASGKENLVGNGGPDMSGRVLIVSNKSENLSTPWIPSHLQQTSARQTIEEIAKMCGKGTFILPSHF